MPDNRDSLIFKIELSDKNSIKEKHLPYNQLLSKGNGNVQVKDNNRSSDRRNFQGKNAENEPDAKRWCDRNGAKTRKRPRENNSVCLLEVFSRNLLSYRQA